MIINVQSETPNMRHIRAGVQALSKGELIVYPTDTLYGLGCDIRNKDAVARIYALKRMDRKKPLSFICHDFSQIADYGRISNHAFKIMKSLAPGPYTFVLPATNRVPKMLQTRQKTVGIRLPDNNFARLLVKEFGDPIISTTITTSDDLIISDPEEIYEKFNKSIGVIFSDGISASDPSTVLKMVDDEVTVLREGKGDVSFLD